MIWSISFYTLIQTERMVFHSFGSWWKTERMGVLVCLVVGIYRLLVRWICFWILVLDFWDDGCQGQTRLYQRDWFTEGKTVPLLMLYYYNSLDGTCWVCVSVGVNVCVCVCGWVWMCVNLCVWWVGGRGGTHMCMLSCLLVSFQSLRSLWVNVVIILRHRYTHACTHSQACMAAHTQQSMSYIVKHLVLSSQATRAHTLQQSLEENCCLEHTHACI